MTKLEVRAALNELRGTVIHEHDLEKALRSLTYSVGPEVKTAIEVELKTVITRRRELYAKLEGLGTGNIRGGG